MDIQTVSIGIAAVSVFIAAINFVISSRKADEQRQSQLFLQLYDRWQGQEYQEQFRKALYVRDWNDWDDYIQKYGPREDPEGYPKAMSLLAFFEGLGVMVKENLIDINLVDATLYRHTRLYWERIEALVLESRQRLSSPELNDHLEYLYHELKRRHPDDPPLLRRVDYSE